jgi:hypothetical protein
MPRSLLCCTLTSVLPRLVSFSMLKFRTRSPPLWVTVGSRLTALTSLLAAPSRKARPFSTPSPLVSTSNAAPPDQNSYFDCTVMVVSSETGTTRSLPEVSSTTAPAGIRSFKVPELVGVTCTVNTPGVVSVIVPMVTADVPSLSKSAAVTDAELMSSLKVTV